MQDARHGGLTSIITRHGVPKGEKGTAEAIIKRRH